jgi:hypothetical protein
VFVCLPVALSLPFSPFLFLSYNAKHGTDIVIEGRNFGNVDELHGIVRLNGSQCYNALFVRDSEIRCTLPGDQVVGETPLIVTTWNPALGNGSGETSPAAQTSNTYVVDVRCPEDYYGRVNEVRGADVCRSPPYSCART